MSNTRKNSGKAGGILNFGGSTPSTNSNHQNHKNLRRHLDMGGQPASYGAGDNSTSSNQQTNLFEIKKRSIDFFQGVSQIYSQNILFTGNTKSKFLIEGQEWRSIDSCNCSGQHGCRHPQYVIFRLIISNRKDKSERRILI